MSGLARGDRIISTLVDLLGDQLIEDLPVTYMAIAVDIKGEIAVVPACYCSS